MENTRTVLLYMGSIIGAIAAVLGWSAFSMWLADYSLWGFAIAYAPMALIPLGIAIYKDLRA